MLLLSLSSSVVSYIAPTNLQRFDTCVIPMYGHAPFPVILGPNITGEVGGSKEVRLTSSNGAFSLDGLGQSGQTTVTGNDYHRFLLDASLSSSIYGKSSSLQVASGYALIIIKT